jgi:hypothetical protein
MKASHESALNLNLPFHVAHDAAAGFSWLRRADRPAGKWSSWSVKYRAGIFSRAIRPRANPAF